VRTFRPEHSRSIHRCATVRLLRRSESAEDSSSCFVKPCWLSRRICAKTFYPWLALPPYHGDGFNFFNDRPDEIDEDVLVLSLGSGGMKRLQKQLPSARPGSFENTLTYDTETDFSTYKRKTPSITRHITYHVFESVDRLTRLSEILAERFLYRVTSKNG